jgi:chemotaxis protein CheX
MSRAGKSSKGKARKAASSQLQLPEVLDLTAASPLAEALLAHRGRELSVDAGGVRRAGAQCLQVLIAAVATWKADGVRLRLANPTAEFLEGCRLLGIEFDQDTLAAEAV